MGPNFRSGSISGEQDGLGRTLRRHRPSQVLDQVERSGARRDEDRLSSRGPGEQEPVAEHHEEAAPDANGLLESLAGAHRLPQQAGQRGRFLVSIPQKNRGNGRIVKKCQKVGNRKKSRCCEKKNQHQKNFFFCLRHKKNFCLVSFRQRRLSDDDVTIPGNGAGRALFLFHDLRRHNNTTTVLLLVSVYFSRPLTISKQK